MIITPNIEKYELYLFKGDFKLESNNDIMILNHKKKQSLIVTL